MAVVQGGGGGCGLRRDAGGAVCRAERRGPGVSGFIAEGRWWRRGGARGGVPDRDSAAAAKSATLGTSSRARRRARARWAGLAWPGWLGRPSSAVFFKQREKKRKRK